MAVSPLALKLIGAGAVAVPTVSLGVIYRENIANFFESKEVNADKELIKILEQDNQDIIFEVKKGGNNLENLNFTGSSNPKTITVSAKISTTNTDKIKGANVDDLKKLNFGKDWTWECQIELKTNDDITSTSIYEGEKLKKSSNSEGLFDILGKDLTNEANKKKEWTNVKIQFVENCSKIAGSNSNINNDVLTRKQSFLLKKGDANKDAGWTSTKQNAGKFYFERTDLFNRWFVEPLNLTKWDLHLIGLAKKDGIQFTVEKNPASDTLSNFSSTQSQPKTVTYTVQSKDNDSQLNGGQSWTWKCVVSFTKKADNSNNTLKQKDKLLEFFGRLEKSAHEEKELKIKFMKDCATFRSSVPTSLSDNTIDSSRTFNLVNESSSNNLTFENTDELEYWFGIETEKSA